MRFLVIGGEPVAQRRARLLVDLGHGADCADLNLRHGEDWWRERLTSPRPARLAFDWTGTTNPGVYDAAFICTPVHTRVQVALECLHVGVGGLFIEAPIAHDLDGLDELQDAAEGRTIMIGCTLRFAFNLPRYDWSLLELVSSRPSNTRRTGVVLAHGRGLSPDIVYPELDLAYAVNGPVYRLDCITTQREVRMRIEHDSMAHTDIRVDACAVHGTQRKAIVSAWDDGAQVILPARPRQYRRVPNEGTLVAELGHFLHCLGTGVTPCNTLPDAAYLVSLTLRTRAGASARA